MSDNVCNENTFNKVYKQWGQSLYRFIFFKCGNEAQANDLVQEAFIKLWNNCIKVPEGKAKSFLYTVTNNMFLNEVAHQKVVLKYAKQKSNEHTYSESPQFVLEEKEYYEKLQKAISNLTEAQRTAFLMNRVDGKKYAEIADILGISVKAVEKRMSQALAALRKDIKEI